MSTNLVDSAENIQKVQDEAAFDLRGQIIDQLTREGYILGGHMRGLVDWAVSATLFAHDGRQDCPINYKTISTGTGENDRQEGKSGVSFMIPEAKFHPTKVGKNRDGTVRVSDLQQVVGKCFRYKLRKDPSRGLLEHLWEGFVGFYLLNPLRAQDPVIWRHFVNTCGFFACKKEEACAQLAVRTEHLEGGKTLCDFLVTDEGKAEAVQSAVMVQLFHILRYTGRKWGIEHLDANVRNVMVMDDGPSALGLEFCYRDGHTHTVSGRYRLVLVDYERLFASTISRLPDPVGGIAGGYTRHVAGAPPAPGAAFAHLLARVTVTADPEHTFLTKFQNFVSRVELPKAGETWLEGTCSNCVPHITGVISTARALLLQTACRTLVEVERAKVHGQSPNVDLLKYLLGRMSSNCRVLDMDGEGSAECKSLAMGSLQNDSGVGACGYSREIDTHEKDSCTRFKKQLPGALRYSGSLASWNNFLWEGIVGLHVVNPIIKNDPELRPHLVYTCGFTWCAKKKSVPDNPKVKMLDLDNLELRTTHVTEPMTFDDFIRNNDISEDEKHNVCYQLYMVVQKLNHVYHLEHRDMHGANVLVAKLDTLTDMTYTFPIHVGGPAPAVNHSHDKVSSMYRVVLIDYAELVFNKMAIPSEATPSDLLEQYVTMVGGPDECDAVGYGMRVTRLVQARIGGSILKFFDYVEKSLPTCPACQLLFSDTDYYTNYVKPKIRRDTEPISDDDDNDTERFRCRRCSHRRRGVLKPRKK